MLHYQPELDRIFLGFELGKKEHFTGGRIVLEGLCQFCLPCGIGFTGKFVLIAVEFLVLDLEKHHVLQVIDDG